MAVDKPIYFEGVVRSINPEAFGFFYCKIKTPNDLKYPVLQTHVKTKDGLRTVAALEQYEDMLFSEEMDNAKKFGYEFEILWVYTFEFFFYKKRVLIFLKILLIFYLKLDLIMLKVYQLI